MMNLASKVLDFLDGKEIYPTDKELSAYTTEYDNICREFARSVGIVLQPRDADNAIISIFKETHAKVLSWYDNEKCSYAEQTFGQIFHEVAGENESHTNYLDEDNVYFEVPPAGLAYLLGVDPYNLCNSILCIR